MVDKAHDSMNAKYVYSSSSHSILQPFTVEAGNLLK